MNYRRGKIMGGENKPVLGFAIGVAPVIKVSQLPNHELGVEEEL